MKFLNSLRQTRIALFALALTCALFVGAGVWRAMALSTNQDQRESEMSRAEMEQQFRAQMRDGLGREVQFARPGDGHEAVRVAVGSATNFIYGRSGVQLNERTQGRLAEIERRVLNGESRRISVDELTDALTETAMERMSTLTDNEIDYAAETLRAVEIFYDGENHHNVMLRANGGGYMSREDFVSQARSLREQAARSDNLLREAMRVAIEEEVKASVRVFSETVPESFGNVQERGVTPAQAILLTYSIASDDPLALSTRSLQTETSMTNRSLRAEGAPVHNSDKLYGVHGCRFSTPLDLVFNDQTLNRLLTRLERGNTQ